MNFKPYADKIVVKPIKKEKTGAGIILTETQSMEHLVRGEVVAVSDGFLLDGKDWPVTSKIGDIVWFQVGQAVKFPFEGEEYQILQEGTVFGKEIILTEKRMKVDPAHFGKTAKFIPDKKKEEKIEDFKTDRPNIIPVEGK